MDKEQAQKKFNEKMWYLVAFVIYILLVWSAFSLSERHHSPCDDYGINCPDELEMRNGDIY